PVANRNRPETANLLGLFLNTLVLSADISDKLTFRQVLRQVRETVLQALEHPDLPFEQLVEILNPPRSLGHNPLFDVMLVVQELEDEGLKLTGLEVERLHVNT